MDLRHKMVQWATQLGREFESKQIQDTSLVFLSGCALYRVVYESSDKFNLALLAEWSIYSTTKRPHEIHPSEIHGDIFLLMGLRIVRGNDVRIFHSQEGLQRYFDSIVSSAPSFVEMHPGMFEGTWPNAEADFKKKSKPNVPPGYGGGTTFHPFSLN
jgi:hypothetical protein